MSNPPTKSSSSLVKLFIGGLPPTLTNRDLLQMFSRWGKVQVMLKTREDGYFNVGYGFILVGSLEQAQQILAHDFEYQGRKIHVQFGRKGKKSLKPPPPGRVYLKNLPLFATDDEITACIQEHCDCRMAYAIRSPQGISKGYGFAELSSQADAKVLLNKGVVKMEGGLVTIEEFNKKQKLDHSKMSGVHQSSGHQTKKNQKLTFYEETERLTRPFHVSGRDANITSEKELYHSQAKKAKWDQEFKESDYLEKDEIHPNLTSITFGYCEPAVRIGSGVTDRRELKAARDLEGSMTFESGSFCRVQAQSEIKKSQNLDSRPQANRSESRRKKPSSGASSSQNHPTVFTSSPEVLECQIRVADIRQMEKTLVQNHHEFNLRFNVWLGPARDHLIQTMKRFGGKDSSSDRFAI